MTTAIVLPVIDPDQARACIATLHPDVAASRLFVIDNCHQPLDLPSPVADVYRDAHNLGVARSWNRGVDWAWTMGHDAVALISSQLRFGPIGGHDLLDVDPDEWGSTPPPAFWHSIVFPLSTFERVGLFDENYHPAYGEDADMQRRVTLAGGSLACGPALDLHTTGDGQGADRLRHDHPGLATINYDALMAYFEAKWGIPWTGTDRDLGYRTPFGRSVPLSWWEPATVDELVERYGITAR